MAASPTQRFRGLRFKCKPKGSIFGHRIPNIFLDSQYPDFEVEVHRFAEESPTDPWPGGRIRFVGIFGEGDSRVVRRLNTEREVNTLAVGESDKVILKDVFCPMPGHARIVLRTRENLNLHRLVYSYNVRTGDWVWATIGSFLTATALVALGVGLDKLIN
jgi:hypothetical protein